MYRRGNSGASHALSDCGEGTPEAASSRLVPRSVFGVTSFCVGSIGIGTVIYLCFRSTSLLVFKWAQALGMSESIQTLRKLLEPVQHRIPEVVLNSFPGALWSFAFALAMGRVWVGAPSLWRLPFLATVPLLALGSEIGQGFGWVPGTYDSYDLFLYSFSILLGFFLANGYFRPTPGEAT